MMKRQRDQVPIPTDVLRMADCLISLSKFRESNTASVGGSRGRVFVCKTCNREFTSFQALGGHRASHRKPKLSPTDVLHNVHSSMKPKTHECSICGLEFPVGQALGGHMRRHRNTAMIEGEGHGSAPHVEVQQPPSDLECVAGNGRLVGLDLNLTPLENDLVRLQLMAPPVGCLT